MKCAKKTALTGTKNISNDVREAIILFFNLLKDIRDGSITIEKSISDTALKALIASAIGLSARTVNNYFKNLSVGVEQISAKAAAVNATFSNELIKSEYGLSEAESVLYQRVLESVERNSHIPAISPEPKAKKPKLNHISPVATPAVPTNQRNNEVKHKNAVLPDVLLTATEIKGESPNEGVLFATTSTNIDQSITECGKEGKTLKNVKPNEEIKVQINDEKNIDKHEENIKELNETPVNDTKLQETGKTNTVVSTPADEKTKTITNTLDCVKNDPIINGASDTMKTTTTTTLNPSTSESTTTLATPTASTTPPTTSTTPALSTTISSLSSSPTPTASTTIPAASSAESTSSSTNETVTTTSIESTTEKESISSPIEDSTNVDLNSIQTEKTLMEGSPSFSETGQSSSDDDKVFAVPYPPTTKKAKPYNISASLDEFDRCILRRMIFDFQRKHPERITLDALREKAARDVNFMGSKPSFIKVIRDIGFSYKKSKKRFVLMESDEIREERLNYLNSITAYRAAGRPIVYIGKFFVDWRNKMTAALTKKNLVDVSKEMIVLAGLEAIDTETSISNPLRMFNIPGTEYDLYETCLTEHLINNIPKDSVIVIDNTSPFHRTLTNPAPKPTASIQKLQSWLTDHKQQFNEQQTDAELFAQIMEYKKTLNKEYRIDVFLTSHNFTILRLPLSHPELNPTDCIWGCVTTTCRKRKVTVDVAKVLADERFNGITAAEWVYVCTNIRQIECMFLEQEDVYKEYSKSLVK